MDSEIIVTKELVFDPSSSDPPEQDEYEYWLYEFRIDSRSYTARRFTDEPQSATIVSTIRDADAEAVADAARIARYLIDVEGVKEVFRYEGKTGIYSQRVEPR